MQNLIKARLFWTGLLLSFFSHTAYSQGIPLGAMPMQYNGSFAGEAGAPRISNNNQYYSMAMNDEYDISYNLLMSYDQFIPALRSGIGFTAGWEHSTYNIINKVDRRFFALDVAPKFSIKGKYTLSPSISINYSRRSLGSVVGDYLLQQGEGFSSRVGILWNTPKYYIGFSMNGVTNYTDQFQHNKSSRKMPYSSGATFQFGYTFQKSSESKFSFTPQLVIRITGDEHINDYSDSRPGGRLAGVNLNFRYSKFIWGVNNAGFHVGLQSDRLRLMVSNNPSFIRVVENNNSNLSLRYVFKEKARK